MGNRRLELLAPAANADIAVEAVKHGADAVYIGGASHGARKSAANTIGDIARVVEYAHKFRARVYATVNTIVYEDELKKVEALCCDLYRAGVDALIVQDMSLLRLDLPPIALHASTQCDIRTPEKARFLQDVGFSQLVLARELTIGEIRAITECVTVPVECFIHGALCVSYSGKCHASCAATGRSANRGECAQICRLPFTMKDITGKVLAKDKHLLSLRDFNATAMLGALIEAGVSSFKIEGRLKEADYVKNITSHYSILLDEYIATHDGYQRSSFGKVERRFSPKPDKSFNRGFTDYFLSTRRPGYVTSPDTPKSMGEEIKDISELHNGDGISFFDRDRHYQGVNVNKIENGRIVTARGIDIPRGTTIHRTYDVGWQKLLAKETAVRKLGLHVSVDDTGVTAHDERGVEVRLPLRVTKEHARNPMDYESEFGKLGNTVYSLSTYKSTLDPRVFIPRSELASLRRELVEQLDKGNLATYGYDYRRPEDKGAVYPIKRLDFRENVSNSLAEAFYFSHGAERIEPSMETSGSVRKGGTVVMTTRHCILRELGMCKRLGKEGYAEPLTIESGSHRFRLRFNCADCEMEVLT